MALAGAKPAEAKACAEFPEGHGLAFERRRHLDGECKKHLLNLTPDTAAYNDA